MKKLMVIAALASGAYAQNSDALTAKLKAEIQASAQMKVVSLRGLVSSNVVKGAPYSATEISEHTQMLFDGTRIHTQSETRVFRDSAGRTRRENGDEITIWDPVANTGYSLNTKTNVASRMSYVPAEPGKPITTFSFRTSGSSNGEKVGDPKEAARLATQKMQAETIEALAQQSFTYRVEKTKTAGTEEALGQQNIEGVLAEGKRSKSVIEVNSIGNDRPIELLNERWYSSELQTYVLTKRTDPRSGEDTFRLTNISRSEPSASLFQVPPGYTLTGQK